jgi:hypothetical protein
MYIGAETFLVKRGAIWRVIEGDAGHERRTYYYSAAPRAIAGATVSFRRSHRARRWPKAGPMVAYRP